MYTGSEQVGGITRLVPAHSLQTSPDVVVFIHHREGKEMFNLLIKANDWNSTGTDNIDITRVLEATDDATREQYSVGKYVNFNALKGHPALFMPESPGVTGNKQLARVGTITNVSQTNRNVAVSYTLDDSIAPIANDAMFTILESIGALLPYESSRTHWAVKHGDLYMCVARVLSQRRLAPTIFDLRREFGADRPLVSAMMPFSNGFDDVYRELQAAANSLDLECRRADDIWNSETVMQDVVDLIAGSRAVIVDCTGQNPNVFYEMGIAHTLGRTVIPIAQDRRDIPFDIRHLRYLLYYNNGEGRAQLRTDVVERLRNLGADS